MASTPSPSLRLELMATGDQSGTWGDTTNVNLGTLLEQAITGYLTFVQSNTTDKVLTNTDYAINETRNAVIEVTGSPGGAFNVITPAAEKTWLFKNSTNQTMTVKVSGQTGVAVPAGTAKLLYCDGTDVEEGLAIPTTYFTSTSTAFSPTGNDAQTLGTSALQWGDIYLASGGFIDFNNNDVRITQSTNTLAFSGASSGYTVDAVLKPATNGGAALGESGTAFSNLFLASGGVINFDAGDVTITHSANTLAFAGATSYTFNGGTAYFAGGTDVALTDGGTGASLTDPGADRIMFWDDSAGAVTWLEAGSGLTITDTTISVSASSPITQAVTNNTATNTQTFNATGTWTKPNTGNYAVVYAWGGGGGGDVDGSIGAGGSGGGFTAKIFALSALGATETVTVGAGGAAGSNTTPGATNFGSLVSAFGAGRSVVAGNASVASGGGGGSNSAGTSASGNGTNGATSTAGRGGVGAIAFVPSVPMQAYAMDQTLQTGFVPLYTSIQGPGAPGVSGFDYGANISLDGLSADYGGASGGVARGNAQIGGFSIWGGGGGSAGALNTAANTGVSIYGGRGGFGSTNTNNPGVQPGGGGAGSTSLNVAGAGAAGKVIVYVY